MVQFSRFDAADYLEAAREKGPDVLAAALGDVARARIAQTRGSEGPEAPGHHAGHDQDQDDQDNADL